MKKHSCPEAGFSLIEMAIVFVGVALLIGGLLLPLTTQIEQQKTRETQKATEEIKEALIGYAASHFSVPGNRPHLPCPDVNVAVAGQPTLIPNDGIEDRCPDTGGGCASLEGRCPLDEGNIPWATLGVAIDDAWGNRFRYRVHPNFSYKGKAGETNDGFRLDSFLTTPEIRVCTGSVSGCTSPLVSTVPAVILSHGKNGWGAVNNNENDTIYAAPTTPDEQGNISTAAENNTSPYPVYVTFVSRVSTPAQTPCSDTVAPPVQPPCEFDDIVTWLSPNILFNRMVAAGRLP